MKSRVFTPFLAAFAGSLILLIGLFLLQGTQTSRTILSGSSVAQAAQTSNAALAASSKFSVTVGIGSATVNNDTTITVVVTPTTAEATTSYTLSVDYGDKTALGTAGTKESPLTGKKSQSFTHKWTTVSNPSVVAKLFIVNVGVNEIVTKTVSVGEAPKVITLGVPTSAYIGQVIPFSVTGTINAVNYTFETIDVTGGKWTVAANADKSVNFPILSTSDLKITAYDPIYKATSTKTVKGVAPTITVGPSKTTASPNDVITFVPTIKGGGKDIPGATPTLLCGKDSTEATVSGLTCTILKATGTVTANVKFTIQPPLPNDVYSLPSANQVKPIVLYGTAASITVGGTTPTATPTTGPITPTGKSTIKIIVGKTDLKACGDSTVITAEVKDSNGKHLPLASSAVTFTVTDKGSGTQIRIPIVDTKKPTTTQFVTTGPGNVIIKAVLKSSPAISATEERLIGPTGDERQCTLKPRPSKDGDLQLDGDDDNSKFNDTTKRWLRITLKFSADDSDFNDVQAISMVADPFCKTLAITPSSTISNSKDMGCFNLKIIKTDGSELTSLTKPISFTIELNGVAWKEIKDLEKNLNLLKQKGTGWEKDSSAKIDTSNLKETTSTLLLATTNPSLELSTTSTGLVGLVVNTTANKVYLPLILRAPTTATTKTLALTH